MIVTRNIQTIQKRFYGLWAMALTETSRQRRIEILKNRTDLKNSDTSASSISTSDEDRVKEDPDVQV